MIPHGVDTRIFHPAPVGKTLMPSIVFVGTSGGRKRGSFLMDVFSRVVRANYPEAQLAFVGPPGPATPGVTYHTGVSDEELAALYRRAWIYASPSAYEGFGLPYLEAMACGTCVVATPNPGSREVLQDGRFGVLADDAAFGDALLAMLGEPQRRLEMEGAGVRRANQLSLDAMLDGYETLLRKAG